MSVRNPHGLRTKWKRTIQKGYGFVYLNNISMRNVNIAMVNRLLCSSAVLIKNEAKLHGQCYTKKHPQK